MNFSFISWLCCEMAARHDGREYETWNYPLVGKRIIERKCKMYCSSTCNSVCCVSTLRFLELPFDQWLKTPEGVGSSELLRDLPSPGRGSNLLCWLDLSFWSSLNFISTRAASWILICLLQISFCWSGIPNEIWSDHLWSSLALPCKFYAPQCLVITTLFRPRGHLVNDHFRPLDLGPGLKLLTSHGLSGRSLTPNVDNWPRSLPWPFVTSICLSSVRPKLAAKEVVDI